MTTIPKQSMTRRRLLETGAIAGLGIAAVAVVGAVVAEGTPTPGTASPVASPAASPAASPVSATSVTVALGEFYFDPNTFTIPANTDVTVTLVNKGIIGHDFLIATPHVSSPLIAAGETGAVTLNLPPGTYDFECSVEGHADAGMYGQVIAQ